MLFTTDWLVPFFKDCKGKAQDAIAIHTVETDSRIASENSLFVPIVGENFDGHDYLKQAFNNGAVAALWQKERELPLFLPTDFPVFFVDDTLMALQQLAKIYRDAVNPIVIGITGSNGKTTTKDLVAAILKGKYNTHFTKGNFNNHIGMPLTILSMHRNTEVLVLEMGMNHFGEIGTLTKIARPNYAIITNIGEAHIAYLGSREGISQAKLEIIQGLQDDGVFIYDGDEPLLKKKTYLQKTITCGFEYGNDVIIECVSVGTQQTSFWLKQQEQEYRIPLLGKHHAQNAAYAITIAKELGMQHREIQAALDTLEVTGMRFEMLAGRNGATIINDAYNASPSSMKASIEVVKQLRPFPVKVLVLGDMFELGDAAKKWHQQVAASINSPISVVMTFGDDAKYIASGVKEVSPDIKCKHFIDKSELVKCLETYLTEESLILFKASRGMNFESIVNELLENND